MYISKLTLIECRASLKDLMKQRRRFVIELISKLVFWWRVAHPTSCGRETVLPWAESRAGDMQKCGLAHCCAGGALAPVR